VEEETTVALTIPELVAERAAAHGGEIVLRKKHRGIWQAVLWSELHRAQQRVAQGLLRIGLQPGDTTCVLAENQPECVYVDIGTLAAGGVSAAIHPAIEADALAEALKLARCRVLFLENEEQLDKALAVRERCPMLRRIVIFDMKGLREFGDPMCESLQSFLTDGAAGQLPAVSAGHPAILLLPQGQVLTHGDALHLVAHARAQLQPRTGDERLALLPMCHVMEHVLGLYLSLDARAISNYLESPDTVVENLQEVQPTLLGTDAQVWQRLYRRVTAAAEGATRVQRALYRLAIRSGGGSLARLAVLRAVRRELGLARLRLAYIGAERLPPEITQWTAALGIAVQQIDGQSSRDVAGGARYRALMEEAYGT
jgi:long-chain acyl-CoA synthetase